MTAQANLPAERRESAPIDIIKRTVASKADEFKAVLPAHISVEKFQRTIATAALANPKLFECDRKSLLMAAMKAAQDGLLPDGREAALVPFKNRVKLDNGQFGDRWEVQYLPMVYGLRKKVLQSGEVISIETGVVYKAEIEAGHFIHEIGMDPPIRYRPKLDLTAEETADDQIIVAFSIARLKDSSGGEPYWSVKVLRRFEIDKIRQMSQTGAVGRTVKFGKDQGKVIPPKGPWVDWFPAMAEKTALRQHTKALPMSGDLLDTLMRDDEEERRAEGAARLLETEPEQTFRLPTNEELAEQGSGDEIIDQETGEVIQRDSRGMTEVDEDAARRLDAGESANNGAPPEDAPETDPRGKDSYPQADFIGDTKPARATRNQTWFNPVDGKLKYAHDKGDHGIKWYMQPQEAATPAPAPAPEPDPRQPIGPSEGRIIVDRIADAADLDALAELQEHFNEAKSRLTDPDIAAIREAFASRRNELA